MKPRGVHRFGGGRLVLSALPAPAGAPAGDQVARVRAGGRLVLSALPAPAGAPAGDLVARVRAGGAAWYYDGRGDL